MIRCFNRATGWGAMQVAALVAAAMVGMMLPGSRADEKARAPVRKKVAVEALKQESGELRKMAIRVSDEQGRPLPGVDVHASGWGGKNRFPNRD